MSAKAPRIPNEIWNQHREEIIALYWEKPLEWIKNHMKERYGFEASENQYTGKLKSWSVKKNLSRKDWVIVASVKRKRSQEGKASDFAFNGRKSTRQKIDKDIARNVFLKDLCGSENLVLPDYITVSTPQAEISGTSREFLLCNLPWYQYTQEIQTLVSKGLQKSIIRSNTGTSLELATKSLSQSGIFPLQLQKIFDDDSKIQTYLPPEHLETGISSIEILGKPQNNSFSVLRVFLQRFVFWSTNNLLPQYQFNEVCEWIIDKLGIDILISLCRPDSPSMKIFARRALCSAVQSGNIRLAKQLFQCRARLQDGPPQSQFWTEYLSDAFYRGHEAMVELLCKAGVPPKVTYRWVWPSGWESRLQTLHTLLAFDADPESFITDKEAGFPLIDAARDGSLQAVKLLVQAGARINLYLSRYCGTALQAAVSRDHLEVAKYLIQSGADCNVPDVQHLRDHALNFSEKSMISLLTPVQLAAMMNDISLLQILLKHGASAMVAPGSTPPDPESICYYRAYAAKSFNDDGFRMFKPRYDNDRSVYTALQYGVLNNNLNLVALLLFTGVDPDSRVATGIGDTPLQMSARLSNFEMFQLLLSSGADINAPPAEVNGRTAVQGAAESGNWAMLSMLQSAGAHINAPAGEEVGLTALQAACLNGRSLMAGFFLAHQADLNAAPSVAGLTAIQAAATYGDIGLVRDLISLGADVAAPAIETGTTALLAATKHKSLPLLEILVRNGAGVNRIGGYELKSPLGEAACGDWLEGVEFLLKHGADVNDTRFEIGTSEEYGDELLSPLGWAITNGSEEMVDLLLRQGADVFATVVRDGIDSESALICALSRGSSLDLINLLFAKVQDLESHPGWEDALCLHFKSFHQADFDVCEMIIEKTSSMPPPLRHMLIQNGWNALYTFYMFKGEGEILEALDFLIKAGADVNHRDGDESTLLQHMAGGGYYESCYFLVDHGADINTPVTQWHGTPLQETIKNKQVKVAEFLLEHGADVNALPADDRGITALQAASINGMLGMAVQLLERGADVSAPAAPNHGRTAIDAAAEHGHLEMVQLLLNAHGEQENLGLICNQAADYAEKEDHHEIAQWLRGYSS